MMYNVFCQKFQISMRTIHEFSIAITREFVLLASRCVKSFDYGLSNYSFKMLDRN